MSITKNLTKDSNILRNEMNYFTFASAFYSWDA